MAKKPKKNQNMICRYDTNKKYKSNMLKFNLFKNK